MRSMSRMGALMYCCSLSWVVVGATNAEAITRRHDRPDLRYQIADSEAPAFVDVMGQVGGTLIAPQWVLTAAHSVEGVDPFSDWRVFIGGRRYDVDKIIIHPGRVDADINPDFDIALLRLATPAEGASPIPLYRWNDEIGKLATMLGRGVHGDGRSRRPLQRDGVLRRAFNRVEGVYEHSLAFVFNSPPQGEELEGSGGAGDSGGPALIERDDALYVAGVGSTNSGDGIETGRYGTLDSYTRVSTHLQWIESTIAADPPSTLLDWPPLTRITETSELPNTPAGALAAQFVDAISSRNLVTATAFFARHGATASSSSPETLAQAWLDRWSESGPQAPWGYTTLSENQIAFVLKGPQPDAWLGYLITVDTSDSRNRIDNLISGHLSGPPAARLQ